MVFLFFGFFILETFFPYKIFFIPESLKIIKNNLDISNNIEVQEEKCRGTERNTLQ